MNLKLTKAVLETIATHSLEGMLLEQGVIDPCAITICFEESTMDWRRRHKGPDSVIIPEFVPRCLCASIVNLIKKGYSITFESFYTDPVAE